MQNAQVEQVMHRRRGIFERDESQGTSKESLLNSTNKLVFSRQDEAQTQSTVQCHVNNIQGKMITTNSVPNKRSLSESSAEDFGRSTHCDTELSNSKIDRSTLTKMWRNKLFINPNGTSLQSQHRIKVDSGSSQKEALISNVIDIALRIAIVIIFIKLEVMTAFVREVHKEELWLYKNPRRPDIVTPLELLVTVIVAPFLFALVHFLVTKDKRDFYAANWAWTLALCMNGLPTSTLKITIGRLRPDFFYRCFPDGVLILNNTTETYLDFNCTGNPSVINEGRKSFPSGHSSFAFASFGFISFYLAGKLHSFNMRGRGQTWRLYIAILPLFLAALVAISRTCDYHHHWQDVFVGAVIGLFAGYISYRQYYPSLMVRNCHRPLDRWTQSAPYDYECIDDDFDLDVDAASYSGDHRLLLNETCRRKRQFK